MTAGSFVWRIYAFVAASSLAGAAVALGGVQPLLREGAQRAAAAWVLGGALASGVATATLVVAVARRRLKVLTTSLERVATADLRVDLPEPPAEEFNDVRESFRRLRDAIDETMTAAAQSDAQRKRRIARLAHDLSNPVTTILGIADVLGDPAANRDDPERAAMLAALNTEIDRVTALVHALRALARAPDEPTRRG